MTVSFRRRLLGYSGTVVVWMFLVVAKVFMISKVFLVVAWELFDSCYVVGGSYVISRLLGMAGIFRVF